MNALTISGLALALLGPGVIAFLWRRSTIGSASPRAHWPWLAAFAFLVASVATLARCGEGLSWSDVGFARMGAASLPLAILLTAFFIFVFGPLASLALRRLGLGSFAAGGAAFASLPRWYLCLTIVVVAGGEEWLYRGYSIERLRALTGDVGLAGLVSLLAFTLAHLPLWGIGPSLTTIFSGGILTSLYIWREDVSFLIVAHVATDLFGLLAVSSALRRAGTTCASKRSDPETETTRPIQAVSHASCEFRSGFRSLQ